MSKHNERGIALVITLLLTATMSVMAASLMFLSQTETYATMNYRMMSQSRYAAEAAIQRAGHFLMDSTLYDPAAEPLTDYIYTGSPVRNAATGEPVVLSATDTVTSTYPDADVQTAFNDFVDGEFSAGTNTLTYGAYAELIAMQSFVSYGGNAEVIQTWRITGIGGVEGPREATVEVIATIETPKVPANSYAAFATGAGCGAMYFHGNVSINSYDSSTPPAAGQTSPTLSGDGGNVGTNGNLLISGSVDVEGNLYSPRTGVGTCDEGAVTALTESGSADVEGSVVQLPTAVSYPPPEFTTWPPTDVNVTVNAASMGDPADLCTDLGLVLNMNCTVSGTIISIGGAGGQVTLPNVTVASGYTVKFVANPGSAQIVNINSLAGTGAIEIDANLTSGVTNESVVLKVAGKNPAGVSSDLPDPTDMEVPFNLDAMSWKQNSTVDLNKFNAAALQIVYPGTGTINMDGGNAQSAATIYAPNADFLLKGTQDLYGSILAKTIENQGNANLHYDRRLSRDFWVAGHALASTFSWKRMN